MKTMISILALVLIMSPSLSFAKNTITFKEKPFHSLAWGIDVKSFNTAYNRSKTDFKFKAIGGSKLFWQDLDLKLYDHFSNTGFQFGQQGLEVIVVSYLFRTNEKRLNQDEILELSKSIQGKLIRAYGEPKFGFPWDGQMFNYIWMGDVTFIQFAWDGSDDWGIQYRSIELDSQVREFKKQLESQ